MHNLTNAIVSLPGWNASLALLLLKATIILLAALGITLAMPRASATARHLVWLVTLTTLLLVPALSAWAPVRVAVLPAAPSELGKIVMPPGRGEALPAVPEPRFDEEGRAPKSSSAAPTPSLSVNDALIDSSSSPVNAFSLLFVIWGAIALVIISTLAWASISVRRIVRRATPLTSPDWQTPLYEIADRLGLDHAPRLVRSADVKMPFACGVLRGTIVLPAEATAWSLDRRQAVLLHELAHVRRHDLIGHALSRLACAVYWFHPLVWTAAKRLRSESERACDDLALNCGTRAADYAEHLLDIVTSVRGDSTPLVALAMARRKEFEGRMLAILDPALRRSAPTRRQSATLIATLALVALSVGAISPVARKADAAVVKQPLSSVGERNVEGQTTSPNTSLGTVFQRTRPDTNSQTRGIRSPDVAANKLLSASPLALSTAGDTETSAVATASTVSASVRPSVRLVVTEHEAVSELALRQIVQASASIGGEVRTAVKDAFTNKRTTPRNGGKGSEDSDDDRPALLAKVLRSDSSASLRRIAAWGLQEYGESAPAPEALSNALRRDADPSVREMAAWALASGNGRSGGALEALATALKSDATEKVRATAAWALGTIGDRSSADALTDALSDQSRDVRVRAAWALGNVEPRQAPKQLVALLGDQEIRVRQVAAWSLFNIADPATAPALEAAIKSEQNKEAQLAEIRALAAMGDKSVDVLRGLLESNDQKVRQMAVRALAGGHATGPWPWPWPQPRPNP